ncbi:MAG: phosphatase [Cyclobacteriaceae bacterium]|nr:phosphatase [Cyclobacteriaceae bacterium]
MSNIITLFEAAGGEFFTPPSVFTEKLKGIRAVLFDWDGVFNEGFKRTAEGSMFSEVDAMGTNLLRFALWRHHSNMPISAIITGEDNPAAGRLAEREHFHHLYFLAKDKAKLFAKFCSTHGLQPSEVLFFFDDVLDLEVARQCGARIMVRRRSTPLMSEFVRSHGMVDYFTGSNGLEHGVREGCELVIGLLGQFDNVLTERMTFSDNYRRYLEERQQIQTSLEEIKPED